MARDFSLEQAITEYDNARVQTNPLLSSGEDMVSSCPGTFFDDLTEPEQIAEIDKYLEEK